ncbi:MAG: hypothetical protein Q7U82_07200, partial [Gammaproteobacteria bacterium]|nr:hypothetical protein [Gammaproteobacteria bacterium]
MSDSKNDSSKKGLISKVLAMTGALTGTNVSDKAVVNNTVVQKSTAATVAGKNDVSAFLQKV